mgnify:CR=1 FL=1
MINNIFDNKPTEMKVDESDSNIPHSIFNSQVIKTKDDIIQELKDEIEILTNHNKN